MGLNPFDSLRSRFVESGLLGDYAGKYGSPDDLLLISSGPISHLSQFSLLCGPSRRRVVIRQPSREILPVEESHSPLSGKTRLKESVEFLFQREIWNGSEWALETTVSSPSLAIGLRRLCPGSESRFTRPPSEKIPFQRPFWAGALSYDLLQLTQPIRLQHPPEENELLCILWEIERCVVYEKERNALTVLSVDNEWQKNAEACIEEDYIPDSALQVKKSQQPNSNCTDAEHEESVRKVQSSIIDGQLYQLNYGRTWTGNVESDPWDIFSHSVTSNPAPYSGYLHMKDEGFALVSASPESLLSTENGVATTAPIKGTAPRGASDAEEVLLREDMISDRKERAEHRMLVDLMRNDVGLIAQPNQVWVERFDVEVYAEVQHLVSRIKCHLDTDVDLFDAIEKVFPGGSITGCPRTVVCAAIDELEREPRSFWTGSMGWFDPLDGNSAWNILIRTAVLNKQGNSWSARVTAGGGITIESNPKSEVAEAKWKANGLLRSCGWIEDSVPANIPRELAIHPLPLENRHSNHKATTSIHTDEFKKNAVLLIDNLDSFTYNIAHDICGLGHHVNILPGRGQSQYSASHLIEQLQPSHIILGPGPGWPQGSPLTMEFATLGLRGETPPLLGICLGHQAIGLASGLRLVPSPIGPVHGTPVKCLHHQDGLFTNLGEISMTRYNSLTHLTADLKANNQVIIDATDDTKSLVLGLRSKLFPVFGIQFHPESVGSPLGGQILSKFLEF